MDLTFPVLVPLRTLTRCLVSWSLLTGMTCLLMPSPSIKTLLSLRISTMVASFPASAPQLILATRPISTNLVYPQIRDCLPSGIVVNYIEYKIMLKILNKSTILKNSQNINQKYYRTIITQNIQREGQTDFIYCWFYQQIYMKSGHQNNDDLQMKVNSPPKRIRLSLKFGNLNDPIIDFTKVSNQPKSLTQWQLSTRILVNQIIQKGKNNTVKQQIGKIDTNIQLYAKPRNFSPFQFKFERIPPQNLNYSSLGSAKIHEIYKGLRSRSTASSLKSKPSYSIKNERKQHQSINNKQRLIKTQRVSVSGLATYKFFSAKAEKSIAFNRINYDQKLKVDLSNVQKHRECPRNRLKKILFKHSPQRETKHSRKESKIIANTKESTDNYLKNMRTGDEQQRLLYGQKLQKLEFIKQYMDLERASYDLARHMIDQIQSCKIQKVTKTEQKRIVKTETDQEVQLQRKKMPKVKNKLKVRYMTFVE